MLMSAETYLVTSESVSEGHPDKVCDKISDAILDAILAQDPMARVACETLVTTGLVVLAGEITTNAQVNYPTVVRNTIAGIGYTDSGIGFDAGSCGVLVSLDRQSPDIAMGVDESDEHQQGAGDQGMMYGFACDETPELMPMPILLAHRLVEELAAIRRRGDVSYLRPDSKSQVTIEYDMQGKPLRIHTVVISTQHAPDVTQEQIREDILAKLIKKVLPADMLDDNTIYHVNPTGRFVVGGPHGDSGLTGRKIIVDTYGGVGRHGGGAFSGKDPSKVDRSAAYAARWVAKNVVAAGLATRCEIQMAYAIGVAQPVSVHCDTFGTGKISDIKIVQLIRDQFDLSPKGIIAGLDLRRPIFSKTAAYGHFGRLDPDFTWEATDRADALRQAAGL